LVEFLWEEGFDATRGASNLYVVPAITAGREAQRAQRALQQVLFLPVDSGAGAKELRRMAAAVLRFEAAEPVRAVDARQRFAK
jgi:hypothetical protein